MTKTTGTCSICGRHGVELADFYGQPACVDADACLAAANARDAAHKARLAAAKRWTRN